MGPLTTIRPRALLLGAGRAGAVRARMRLRVRTPRRLALSICNCCIAARLRWMANRASFLPDRALTSSAGGPRSSAAARATRSTKSLPNQSAYETPRWTATAASKCAGTHLARTGAAAIRSQRSASSPSNKRLVLPARRSATPSATYLQSVTTIHPPREAEVSAAQSAAQSSARPTVCRPMQPPTWKNQPPSCCQATAQPAERNSGSRPQTALPSVQQMVNVPIRGGRSVGTCRLRFHSRTCAQGGAQPETRTSSPKRRRNAP